ncbi:uncharacterized protein F4812DRAFT_431599 [Daldinia caldariorum]|uniref:uncharacterized protein n=1 Tax=Daldinia caldariorum TaxID=326644 RepID=UPI002008C180|nr:uncharacterized protein F4812DRAFT_431599 [Daldinia caldariorum]KAI1467199.1 hypothetical protein F4812DRAFT_431599 [Daldinia caldariorum]
MPRTPAHRLPGVSRIYPWPKEESLLERKKNPNLPRFEVSELLLNLDAEDNPYVRPFNEDIDGTTRTPKEQRQYEIRPVRKLADRLQNLSKKYERQFAETASRKFSAWRITNYDILSVALRNPPKKKPSLYDEYVMNKKNVFFDKNGIPYNVLDSPSKTIAYMLHRQKIANRVEPTRDDLKKFQEAIDFCSQLHGMERLFMDVIRTPVGRWLVANSADAFARACARVVRITRPDAMLTFLNNLIMLLEQEKAEVPPLLLDCAITTSMQLGVFEAAQKYMGMALGRSASLDREQVVTILQVLHGSITPPTTDAGPRIQRDPTYPLLAIYSLLTGRAMGEREIQPSLGDFMSDSTLWDACHKQYLLCLARLGAFRAMWHIWLAHPRPLIGQTSKAEVFAEAINKALSVNCHLAKLSLAPSFTRVGQTYADHYQFDMRVILELTEVFTMPPQPTNEELREESERFPPLSSRDIEVSFGNGEIGQSMLSLQGLLSSRIPAGVDDAGSKPT